GEEAEDERDAGLAEDVAQRDREGARAGRIVRAVQHEEAARAMEDLETARPPRPREPVANRGVSGAHLARGGDREERVGRLKAAGHRELETGQRPFRPRAGKTLAVRPAALHRDRQVAPLA